MRNELETEASSERMFLGGKQIWLRAPNAAAAEARRGNHVQRLM